MTDTTTRWRMGRHADLLWQSWGDQTVIYHRQAGDTHLLNPFSAQALRHIEQQPASLDQLMDHLCSHFDMDADDQLRARLAMVLDRFTQLGLLEKECD